MNSKNIPIIINNRNRVSTLKALIDWLESVGTQTIFVVDNASTYEPLIEYYQKSPHTILRLRENVGYLAFWELGIWERFQKNPYCYTDSDVVPVKECPADYLEVFQEGLTKNPDAGKVGFSLKINDLPDAYVGKKTVIDHENAFWQKKRGSFYDAPIDTTFALYRGSARGGVWVKALRSPPPYIARHLPWYVNSSHLDAEELFYRRHANQDSTWTFRDQQITEAKKADPHHDT